MHVRSLPIEERKAALKKLLGKSHPGIEFHRTFDVEGSIVFHMPASSAARASCRSGLARHIGQADR
jgi:hypothetical protein